MPETNTAPAADAAARTPAVAGYGAAEIIHPLAQGSGEVKERYAAALQLRPRALAEQIAASRASGGGPWDVAHVEKPGEQDRSDGVTTDGVLAQLAGLLALPREAAK